LRAIKYSKFEIARATHRAVKSAASKNRLGLTVCIRAKGSTGNLERSAMTEKLSEDGKLRKMCCRRPKISTPAPLWR
jgi:hypothetical protein